MSDPLGILVVTASIGLKDAIPALKGFADWALDQGLEINTTRDESGNFVATAK